MGIGFSVRRDDPCLSVFIGGRFFEAAILIC